MVNKDITLRGDYDKLKDLVFHEGLQAVIEIYRSKFPDLDLNFATVMWVQYREFPLIIKGNTRNIIIKWN